MPNQLRPRNGCCAKPAGITWRALSWPFKLSIWLSEVSNCQCPRKISWPFRLALWLSEISDSPCKSLPGGGACPSKPAEGALPEAFGCYPRIAARESTWRALSWPFKLSMRLSEVLQASMARARSLSSCPTRLSLSLSTPLRSSTCS